MENKENVVQDGKVNYKNRIKGVFMSPGTLCDKHHFDMRSSKRIILFLMGLVGLQIFAVLAYFFLVGLSKDEKEAASNIIAYAVTFAVLVAICFVDFKKIKHIFSNKNSYLFGFIFGFTIIVFDAGYINLLASIYPDYAISGNEEGVRSIIAIYPICSIIFLGILGPLCEEITYRVGLFGVINKYSKFFAYLISSLIFAAVHFNPLAKNIYVELANLPAYIVPGFIFAFAYDKYGLSCSWTAHMINNLYAVACHLILLK